MIAAKDFCLELIEHVGAQRPAPERLVVCNLQQLQP